MAWRKVALFGTFGMDPYQSVVRVPVVVEFTWK
jgi:hypothetical protein